MKEGATHQSANDTPCTHTSSSSTLSAFNRSVDGPRESRPIRPGALEAWGSERLLPIGFMGKDAANAAAAFAWAMVTIHI
jgi:hypothetical protein